MTFEKVNSKVVKVNLAQVGEVLARKGAMLYYTGQVGFVPEGPGGMPMPGMGAGMMPGMGGHGHGPGGGLMQGMLGAAGRHMAGEHEVMMRARGNGEVWYGRAGLHCTVVTLQGNQLTAEASRLLAHTTSLQSSIVSIAQASGGGMGGGGGGLRGMLRGAVTGAVTGQGMFTTQLSGMGAAVLLSHGGTLELPVRGMQPTFVDPQAYVGHVGNVTIELTAALSWRDAVGRGSGEATQLKLTGDGIVYVQASEQKL